MHLKALSLTVCFLAILGPLAAPVGSDENERRSLLVARAKVLSFFIISLTILISVKPAAVIARAVAPNVWNLARGDIASKINNFYHGGTDL